MTAAKNVYALMLALVIVLSGCFGTTTEDTDAQVPENDSTNSDDEIDQGGVQNFADIGYISMNESLCTDSYNGNWRVEGSGYCQSAEWQQGVLTFSSNHSFIKIIEFDYWGDNARVTSQCLDNGINHTFETYFDDGNFGINWVLPGAGADEGCIHTLDIRPAGAEGNTPWSIVWNESPVTVV